MRSAATATAAAAGRMSTKTTAVTGERTVARDHVLKAFDAALVAAVACEDYSDVALVTKMEETQNAAFTAAFQYGWDAEADPAWQPLKMTAVEVAKYGKEHFMAVTGKTEKSVSLWQDEHPKANVPDVISNHPELEDISWHNDIMPSFQRKGWDSSNPVDVRLWVDYEDQDDSEFPDEPDWTRYHVESNNDGDCVTFYRGFDPLAAIEALLAATNDPTTAPASSVGH